MLIYEVNLDVDQDIEADYLAWLAEHIEQLLAIDGFESARVFRHDSEKTDHFGLSCHYEVRDSAALQAYFDEHAASMRGDGVSRFEGRFSAWRRVLEPADL